MSPWESDPSVSPMGSIPPREGHPPISVVPQTWSSCQVGSVYEHGYHQTSSNFIHPSLFSHEKVILSGNLTWLMENCSLIMDLPTKMVIVHSYVSLPKGNFEDLVAFLGSNRGKPVLRFQKRRWSKRWSQAMESWPLLQPTFMITCHQAPSKIPREKGSFLRWFDGFNVVNPVLSFFPNITIHVSSFL